MFKRMYCVYNIEKKNIWEVRTETKRWHEIQNCHEAHDCHIVHHCHIAHDFHVAHNILTSFYRHVQTFNGVSV